MTHVDPSFFDELDPDAEDAKGLADIEAGSVISHEAMMRWTKSWGTPGELPMPSVGD